MGKRAPEVTVIMGSVSDSEIVSHCTKQLEMLGVSFELKVLSAHRTPKELEQYIAEADARG
ncbi:MAG: AIR carboxylase family protein, partial [Planctomycetes bacterium]|nr:AIR carboxylase family protein [Planctomycetota bacterium]